MKNLLLFAFLLLAGSSVNAQTRTNEIDLPALLIGKWIVLDENSYTEPKSITFFADGIINLIHAGTNLSQRYKVSRAALGFKVEILEVINGNPLSSFHIVPLNKEEMQLSYGEDSDLRYWRLKKQDS